MGFAWGEGRGPGGNVFPNRICRARIVRPPPRGYRVSGKSWPIKLSALTTQVRKWAARHCPFVVDVRRPFDSRTLRDDDITPFYCSCEQTTHDDD